MSTTTKRRVILYARLSVTQEESVSIERQLEAGHDYCRARGWEVVGEFRDDGISATHNRPEDRKGWQQVLQAAEHADIVLVWKIDRLARRVLDFLHADEALQKVGAAIAAVEDPVDMSTPQGRAFAQVLAVFGEMEAAAIATRVAAARRHLIKAGRVVGGKVPYGWRSIPNPDGSGRVLAKDPETIGYVEEAVARVLRGVTVYAVQQWLNDTTPGPTGNGWAYSTTERMLRHPVLAGMTPYNPGNSGKVRGVEVLRDETGLPVIDESVAILSTDDRRRLIEILDGRDTPQARPRSSKGATSPLWSRVARCGDHPERYMNRGTNLGREIITCPDCHQTMTTAQLLPHVEQRLLDERGDERIYLVTDVAPDNSAELRDIEEALRDLSTRLLDDDEDDEVLMGQITALKAARQQARTAPAGPQYVATGQTVRQAWESAQSDEERREVLLGQIEVLEIHRGKVGRYLDPGRVRITWAPSKRIEGTPKGSAYVPAIGKVTVAL